MGIYGIEVWYEVKHFEEGSRFGVDGGRISKLSVRMEKQEIISYDRGWDILPQGQLAKQVFAELLKKYN